MRRPLLELLVAPMPSVSFCQFVHRLSPWCKPVSVGGGESVAARLASSPHAPGVVGALADALHPLAVWLDDEREDETQFDVVRRAAALISATPLPGVMGGDTLVVAPDASVSASNFLPCAPFVRARYRERHHLPDRFVITVGESDAALIDDALIPTLLSLASSAVVVGPWTLSALALGTPIVTDSLTAASLTASDGVHVLVGTCQDERWTLAQALADDLLLAARLSRQGRRLVESAHAAGRPEREVLRRLGILQAAPRHGVGALVDRIDELVLAPQPGPSSGLVTELARSEGEAHEPG